MKVQEPIANRLETGPINACGLASISESDLRRIKPQLRADEGDQIIADMVRACACGQKTIVYAYTMQKVNKLCLNCGAFESKESIVEGVV